MQAAIYPFAIGDITFFMCLIITRSYHFLILSFFQVVFGFCIDECGAWSATNIDAKYILQDLKGFDDRFACNGGASFWASKDDVEGEWSDVVSQELSKTEGCSAPTSSSSTTVPNSTTSTTTSSTTSISTSDIIFTRFE